jgi:hypothetical protein
MAKMNMTDAILKCLEEFDVPTTAKDLYEYAVKKGYLNLPDFGKTPEATLQSRLGDFIRNNDTRVKRIKNQEKVYCYYLASREELIKFQNEEQAISEIAAVKKEKKTKDFTERSLHKLFVSFLKNGNIYSKTIFHEKSNSSERSQIWTHPDIVGVKFLELEKTAKNFLKAVNVIDLLNIYSYELKIEIRNDTDLKEKYFQAVSNSSWANYGYLVAIDIEDYLLEELGRLNKAFGIGFIKLSARKPFESKVIFEAKHKNLDFSTINKLCKQNSDFSLFLDETRKIVEVSAENLDALMKNFERDICDEYFGITQGGDIEKYCNENNIPIEDDEEMKED